MSRRLSLLIPAFIFLPAVAFAQSSTIWDIWNIVFTTVRNLARLAWVATVLAFLWGLVQFIQKADDPKAKDAAKKLMVGAVVAFVAILSFWGIVSVTVSAFNMRPDSSNGGGSYVYSDGSTL